jgi:uncharacterized CHY-type Zn-finger protein
MAKLNSNWFHAFQCSFETEEDVIEFIFERLNLADFEDSYIQCGNGNDANTMEKYSAEDKKQTLYDFMMDLVERAGK